uniref:uncharacterized protein LOC120344644 n=1 Tax=Styela clava TaxID=7725 RepID=UPI00193ACFD9|nr:uncharacterized protein LOC120344644 [Styela clava]
METMICECDRPSEHIGTHHDQVQTADDEVYKAPKVSTFFIIQGIQITENAYQAEKQYQEENMELIDKIHGMAAVMRHAANVDDEQYLRDHGELSRLQTENDVLREMLMIFKSSFGSRLITTEQKDSEKTEKPENESEMVLTDDTTCDKTVIHEGNPPLRLLPRQLLYYNREEVYVPLSCYSSCFY